MTNRATTAAGMILPATSTVDGTLTDPTLWSERRVPIGAYHHGERDEPRALAHYLPCLEHGGRHLFDVIEAGHAVEHDDDEHGPYAESIVHRTRLTCVRCGLILEHRGEYVSEWSERIAPAPTAVGNLRAQQIDGRDYSKTWAVYDAADLTRRLCLVSWDRTPRGRERYVSQIDGDTVLEAPTVTGLLRKIAKARQT